MNQIISEYTCVDCGADVYMGWTFCKQCGGKLEWDSVNEPATENKRENIPPISIISPLSLGDIFSRTIQLISKSFIRYLFISAVLFIPISVLFTVSMDKFYSTVGDTNRVPGFNGFASALEWVILSVFLLVLTYLAGTISVTSIVRSELSGVQLSWQDSLKSGVSVYLWRALGQLSLVTFGFMLTFVIIIFFFSIGNALGGLLFSLPLLLTLFPMIVYFGVKLSFSLTSIVCENCTVLDSISRSWNLVHGSWWRVFGIMFLMGLMTGFAITVVCAPVSFFSFLNFYLEYFNALNSDAGKQDPETLLKSFQSLGLGIGVSTSLNLVLSVLITPIYTTLLYYDLRFRRGEFTTSFPNIENVTEKVKQDDSQEGLDTTVEPT
jgi:hypothetical protein